MTEFQKMKLIQFLTWAVQLVTKLQADGPFRTPGLAENFCSEAQKHIQELEEE